jgi:serine protease inhibitor
VQTAMHMTANATAGSSRDQMLKGLYMGDWKLPDLNQRHQQWHQSVIKNPSHPTISSTNGFFKDPERLKANKDFTDRLQKYYNAKLMDLDFDQANQAKQQINDWVKQQTQDKIDKIVEEIRSDDVGFLINALYYKSDWKRPFPEARTSKRAFQKQSGQSVQVPFMYRDGRHHFHKGDRFMVLDKPFKGGKFSLTVVAPRDKKSLKQVITGLQPSTLKGLYQELDTGRAKVLLPKMDLSYKEKLIDDLEAPLGLNLKKANIQNMGESLIGGRLKITRVVHKSVLKVDEKGAEGAAVTSVGATVTSAPPVLMYDQPFMVMLRHVPTNSLLFMGKVMEP